VQTHFLNRLAAIKPLDGSQVASVESAGKLKLQHYIQGSGGAAELKGELVAMEGRGRG